MPNIKALSAANLTFLSTLWTYYASAVIVGKKLVDSHYYDLAWI
jgi:hypothetical protein